MKRRWLLGKDPQKKLPFLVGLEGRRDDDVSPGPEFEPRRDFPEIDERLGLGAAGVVAEEVRGQGELGPRRVWQVVEHEAWNHWTADLKTVKQPTSQYQNNLKPTVKILYSQLVSSLQLQAPRTSGMPKHLKSIRKHLEGETAQYNCHGNMSDNVRLSDKPMSSR